MAIAQESNEQDVPILQDWRGDYPVAELGRFPEGQRRLPLGYLDNELQFSNIWKAFKPTEKVPEVDFNNHLVLFVRNAVFFNRLGIAKVLLKDSVAEILAMETMSAFPIEDRVGMALAVISRAGVKFIAAGDELITVSEIGSGLAADPLNSSYTIEGRKIFLQDGRLEEPIDAGSVTKIRTFVVGSPVEGDLDSDGDRDAVLFLAQDSGGSGMFYYVAAALNQEGLYQGTNGVLLGDRITPQNITIKNGLIAASYKDRKATEPMSADPSVDAKIYLTLADDELEFLKVLEADEQIVEGLVTIGHEVRSFRPCSEKDYYWLSGDSQALVEIKDTYQKVSPSVKPYTPKFMVLAGKFGGPSHDGFGMDYKGTFGATQLVGVRPDGKCPNESIIVDSPVPGETITSPLVVRGRARGTWFFEGDFPVTLKDINGRIIANGYAAAKSDWMTNELVEFEGILEFEKPEIFDSARLVFKKANPTDRSEFDEAMEFFVFINELKKNVGISK